MATKKRGRGKKTQQKVERAFREVNRDEPDQVQRTRQTKGAVAAERQKKRIALEKARRRGARVPKP